jgi:hypothetical protein
MNILMDFGKIECHVLDLPRQKVEFSGASTCKLWLQRQIFHIAETAQLNILRHSCIAFVK